MDAKLTLKLDKKVIEKAKKFALSRQTSLSRLIENYLLYLTKEKEQEKDIPITPLIKSLSGIIQLPEDFDQKKAYRDYLNEKYK